MFRIDLHALWSYDFLPSLNHLFVESMGMEMEEAKALVEGVKEGRPRSLFMDSHTQTTLLAQELLQLGMFISVTQIGRITDDHMVEELKELMGEDLSGWLVLLDEEEEHVLKIVESRGLMMLGFESQYVKDAVGEEILQRGGAPINQKTFEDIEARYMVWRNAWIERIRAAIARKKRAREEAEGKNANPAPSDSNG